MKKFLKRFLGLLILGAGVAFTALLWATRPQAETKEEVTSYPVMKVMEIERSPRTFEIPSQGVVEADRRSRIASEVAGRVEEVSPDFEVGQSVAEGDLLVRLDPTDYRAARAQARSALAEAEAALANEEARARQAEADWRKLGRSGDPPELVARIPQLRSVRTGVEFAEEALEQAEKNLTRTEIRAPYDGVIAGTSTEKGSYLTPGSPVAEIFATKPYEVRLPLSVDEAAFLETDEAGSPSGPASLSATAAGITRTWEAEIIRSEGEIDRDTRSLFVIARVGDSETAEGVEMRPGLFVEAAIEGRRFPAVAAIPFRSFLDLDTVVVVDPDDRIQFRDVAVLRREGDTVYVNRGIEEGVRVALTEMPDLVEGMRVQPEVVSPPSEEEPETSPNTAARNEP